jgi:hypothetical protein
MKIKRIIATLALTCVGLSAQAYTECAYTIQTIYRGDSGFMQVQFNGVPPDYFNLSTTNVDFKDIYAMVLTALVAGNTVLVRYAGTFTCGTTAGQNRSDFQSMRLYK